MWIVSLAVCSRRWVLIAHWLFSQTKTHGRSQSFAYTTALDPNKSDKNSI